MLPDTDVHHMPPVRFHELSQAERDLAIQVLSSSEGEAHRQDALGDRSP